MKATEIKIGDWVDYNGEATQIYDFARDVVWFLDGSVSALMEDIRPVLLTSEILEKNGWCWDEDDLVYASDFCPHVYLAKSGNMFNVVDGIGEQLGKINAAVHELQHILWALGMDDDLKI